MASARRLAGVGRRGCGFAAGGGRRRRRRRRRRGRAQTSVTVGGWRLSRLARSCRHRGRPQASGGDQRLQPAAAGRRSAAPGFRHLTAGGGDDLLPADETAGHRQPQQTHLVLGVHALRWKGIRAGNWLERACVCQARKHRRPSRVPPVRSQREGLRHAQVHRHLVSSAPSAGRVRAWRRCASPRPPARISPGAWAMPSSRPASASPSGSIPTSRPISGSVEVARVGSAPDPRDFVSTPRTSPSAGWSWWRASERFSLATRTAERGLVVAAAAERPRPRRLHPGDRFHRHPRQPRRRPLPRRAGRSRLRLQSVRGDRRAAGVSLLGRTRLQDPLSARADRSGGADGGAQHSGRDDHRVGRLADGEVRRHAAAAELSAGDRRRAVRQRADRGPLRPRPDLHRRRQPRPGRRGGGADAADPRRARTLLRPPLSLCQARPDRGARLLAGGDGEPRRHHLRRPRPAHRSPGPECRAASNPGTHRRPRAGSHVVRRPGDDALVGRPLAQRVVRRLDGQQDHRRALSRAGVGAGLAARGRGGDGRRRPSQQPAGAPAGDRRLLGDGRAATGLRQGPRRPRHGRRVGGSRGVPQGGARLLGGARLGQRHRRRSLVVAVASLGDRRGRRAAHLRRPAGHALGRRRGRRRRSGEDPPAALPQLRSDGAGPELGGPRRPQVPRRRGDRDPHPGAHRGESRDLARRRRRSARLGDARRRTLAATTAGRFRGRCSSLWPRSRRRS